MSIGPILPGRIPGSLTSSRLRQNLERTNLLLARLRDQVATGQKFFLPSESPAAAARTISLQKTIERQLQLQTNVNTDRSLLSSTESILADVTNFLNQGKSFLLAGVGDSVSPAERESMAIETAALIRGVVNAANSSFRGRYLFGGSQSLEQPFEILTGGFVRYNGDRHNIESFIDFNLLIANNVDGDTAFAATTQPVGSDVDPALTLDTKLADLLGGDGVERGSIVVTVDDGVNPIQTETVDFSNAESIRDIKTILEDAFSGGPPTLTVDIDPASNFGLRLTPSGGTVAVADLPGSKVAAYLGIESAAAATINGTDLDPRLTRLTPLSALNNGAGATVADGLFIINGPHSQAVDLSTATTIEDLFNILEAANLDLDVGINQAGNGLAIASRLSGANSNP
jgi:flagellar hook-associated protein 3 FlgL